MTELNDLPLGSPAKSALAAAGITTLAQAATRTRAEVAALHGVGPRAITALEAALAESGLAFRDASATDAAPVAAASSAPAVAASTPAAATVTAPVAPIAPDAPYSVFAIVSLSTALFFPIIGVVFGHLALRDIRVKRERGREMALAGLIIGYVVIAFTLLFVLVWFGMLIAMFGSILWLAPMSGMR